MEGLTPLTDDQRKLVEANVPLIYFCAQRYRHIPTQAFEDLTGRLFLRLCLAVQNFDPGRNLAISSYLVRSLTGEIKVFFRDELWTIKPPRRLREKIFQIPESESRRGAVLRTCALPLSLSAAIEGPEESFHPDDLPGEVNVEREVTDRMGGSQILREVFAALAPEERTLLALMMKGRDSGSVAGHFAIGRQDAGAAAVELKTKLARIYYRVLEGEPVPPSGGSRTLRTAFRKCFVPTTSGYLAIRERALGPGSGL